MLITHRIDLEIKVIQVQTYQKLKSPLRSLGSNGPCFLPPAFLPSISYQHWGSGCAEKNLDRGHGEGNGHKSGSF